MTVLLSARFLRDRVDAGATLAQLAVITGLSASTVRRHCLAHGIALAGRPGRRRKVPPDDEIIRRIEAGERPSDIAKSCGAHPSAVHLSLYRAGLRLDRGRIFKKEI